MTGAPTIRRHGPAATPATPEQRHHIALLAAEGHKAATIARKVQLSPWMTKRIMGEAETQQLIALKQCVLADLGRGFVSHQFTPPRVVEDVPPFEPITREEARTRRDAIRPELERLRDKRQAYNEQMFDSSGMFRSELSLEDREIMKAAHRINSKRQDYLARFNREYNDIIAYRPDANVNADSWEAVDAQDWKREKAEAAQRFIALAGDPTKAGDL